MRELRAVWVPALALAVVGLLAVYSASMPLALQRWGDPLHFARRQLVWSLVAAILFLVVRQVPLELWRRSSPWLFLAGLVVVGLMQIPGVATVRNGAGRWLSIAGLTVQPSEFLKPVVVVYLAKVLSSDLFRSDPRSSHFFSVLAWVGLAIVCVALQPDLGGAALLGATVVALLLVAGAPWRLLAFLVGIGGVAVAWMIVAAEYRMGRVLAFLDPWSRARDYGYQLVHSYLALGSGGLGGRGLGLGLQKLFYLPEAHTDFILSVIGEESGFLGIGLVLGISLWLVALLHRLARRAPEGSFEQFVATGAMLLFGLGFVTNAAVVAGLAPTKGLTLPLVSYGGSALVAAGILLGICDRIQAEVER